MSGRPTFVIVGGGLTAAAAAHALRSDGFDGRVIIVGAEHRLPYERPPLSKAYLRGEPAAADPTFLSEAWYQEHEVDVLLGERVDAVDVERRVAELEDGGRFAFDSLLVATGGQNRTLPIPGWDLDGVLGLRTIEDADRIREAAVPGARVVIAGAGFIGCEVAASLRHLGVEVDVVDMSPPLLRVLGPDVSAIYAAMHREHGVRFHHEQRVERFEGAARVERVVTTTGEVLETDFVITGVGIVPVTAAVEGSGIELSNGILVDERFRTTAPGVFAAGDVANRLHPRYGRLRVEHYDSALKQGAAAARAMLGRDDETAELPWFWSDQYDTNLQYLGLAKEWDEFVTRGSLEERDFVGFYLKDGVVDAAVGMNRGRDVRRAAGVISSRRPVDTDLLRDEDVDIRGLVGEPARGSVSR
jgi:3-phenylpropionate/trans-cinnamate dioxygenase ferredoxin reductase component